MIASQLLFDSKWRKKPDRSRGVIEYGLHRNTLPELLAEAFDATLRRSYSEPTPSGRDRRDGPPPAGGGFAGHINMISEALLLLDAESFFSPIASSPSSRTFHFSTNTARFLAALGFDPKAEHQYPCISGATTRDGEG